MVLFSKNQPLDKFILGKRFCLVENSLVDSSHDIVMDAKSERSSLQIKSEEVVVLLHLCLCFVNVIVLWVLT